MSLSQRVLGAVDLAIEFATLGEYGLEQIARQAPGTPRRAVPPRAFRSIAPDWEALATARRGACRSREPATMVWRLGCRAAGRTSLG